MPLKFIFFFFFSFIVSELKVEMDMVISFLCNLPKSIFVLHTGPVRNVYFPFDILHDTPLDVAIEMVKELEISEWEPFEIAEMIDGEISALIPRWRHSDLSYSESYHTFNYEDGDDEPHHPFYPSSPCSSSHASLSGLRTTNGYDSLHGMWCRSVENH